MNVYQYIRNFAASAEVDITDTEVVVLAATLKLANFQGELTEREQEMATPILATRLGRISGSRTLEAAKEEAPVKEEKKKEDHVVQGSKDVSAFEKIDAMVAQGKCARCGQPTQKVSLSNYEEVHFCPGCRTTLW